MPNITFTPDLPQAPGIPPFLKRLNASPFTGSPVLPIEVDELSSLLPMILTDSQSHTGICFPIIDFKEDLSKALAVHTFPNQDSARVENLGNNPRSWSIKAIFTNHIDPDPTRGETWKRGTLFPDIFIQVLKMLASAASKVMQHPIYGNVAVQVHSYDYELIAKGPRDGAYVIINLIETISDNLIPVPIPLSIITAGSTLNQHFNDSPPDFPPPPGISLSQFFGQLAAQVQNVLNYPSGIVSAVQEATLAPLAALSYGSKVFSSINASNSNNINPTSAYSRSQNYLNTIANGIIAVEKQAPLGTPSNPFPSNNNINIIATSTNSAKPNFTMSATTSNAIQSLLSLNNNPSKDAATFIDKATSATNNLLQYYIEMNSIEVSNIIAGLKDFILTLQNASNQIATNTNLKNVQTTNYITITNMSWQQLSQYLNNSIDNLFSLNQIPNSNLYFVPANTSIKYYQLETSNI